VLITGATGTLGQAFARVCAIRGLPFHLLRRADMDVADPASVDAALERWQPWAIVNTAGFVRVDDAEHEARQWRENVTGPQVLAQACARHGIQLLSFSTDLVFDGAKDQPYIEIDRPRPLNAYGRAKHESERRMLAFHRKALVVRTAAFFGPWDSHNFITLALQALQRGEPWKAAADQWVSPTYVPDLCHHALDLLVDGEGGIWHLANRGAVSWSELACMAAEAARLDRSLVQPVPGATLGQLAPRPRYSALASERGMVMPTLEHGLQTYMAERGAPASPSNQSLESALS
jgi:dTDP-4-dehydrorhamnose reductase